MSNENTQAATENPKSGKKPSHTVYHVVEYDNGNKSKWDQVGAAWEHKDGKGFNISLKLFPVNGKLTIRPRQENAKAEEKAS